MQLFVNSLKDLLHGELPGREAQMKMVPESVRQQRIQAQKNTIPVHSSVLILFYPYQHELTSVLIKRHQYNGVHSNQVAFPGGKAEADDADLFQTALREAYEEMNIIPAQVQILGKLTDLYVPPSNYLIHPVVGFASERPEFLADKREVNEFFELKLSEMIAPEAKTYRTITFANGLQYYTPCYVWKNYIVWGATAMIISELIELLTGNEKNLKLFTEKKY